MIVYYSDGGGGSQLKKNKIYIQILVAPLYPQ